MGSTTVMTGRRLHPHVEGAGPRPRRDRGYLAGLVGVLALEAAGATYQIITGTPVPVVTVAAAVFVVACMLRIHGLRGSIAFLALVFIIPFGSEFLGVLTGFPYGAYAYSTLVGPRLFGLVPVFIYIAWVNISYLAITTTTVGLGRSRLWRAPVDGLVAVAWDAMVDPLAVRAGYWTWLAPGGFYGVPLSNFLGWFLVVTALSLAARAVWARDTAAPASTSRRMDAIMPTHLVGWSAAFAAIAVASGLPIAALAGLLGVTPAVGLAWIRARRQPSFTNPWTWPTRIGLAPRSSAETERP